VQGCQEGEKSGEHDKKTSHYLIISLAFSEILNFLKFEQQVQLQILNKTFYNLVIPRFLQYKTMTIRPTLVYFNF